MPSLAVRWSEHEATKAYARPFAVTFIDENDAPLGAIAVSGRDLLYYRQFQIAVLALAGELYQDPAPDAAADDAQRGWLDRLDGLLPVAENVRLRPVSTFDHERGRVFHVNVEIDGTAGIAVLEPATLLEYQEFQAGLAHRTGRLYRNHEVESFSQADDRQAAWVGCLSGLMLRPSAAEALSEHWPWHSRARER